RAALLKAISADIQQIPDREVQRYYDSILKDRLYKAFSSYKEGYKAGSAKGFGGADRGKRPAAMNTQPPPPPVRKPEVLQGRILLAALLNYPELTPALEEHIWQMPENMLPGDEKLRQVLVEFAGEAETLDREVLHHHIKQAGLAHELGDILNQRTYIHASFCAPGGETHEVRQKWLELWQAIQARNVGREVRSGWQEALLKGDVEGESRFRLLKLESGKADENTGSY
ncbi:MAG: hypothetical protein LRY57_01995, partial [Alphaproteobacteria bacterium]|nr:hypothetical protein [Alphaproteobacteria bacterium]